MANFCYNYCSSLIIVQLHVHVTETQTTVWAWTPTCIFPYQYIPYERMMCAKVFLISTPLAQIVSYLALYSSLLGPDGTVNYDYIVTNRINALLIGSRCSIYS